ncbi:arginase [Algirhabdus cladophorae]|uniref:arginase n=1 Tax=Algirhabdus cladophorae TaxID=3377108 RepID=UPI003B847211
MTLTCALVGAPVQTGTQQDGCIMGPDAFRTAGLARTIETLGHRVIDLGNAAIDPVDAMDHPNPALRGLSETAAWAATLEHAAFTASQASDLPIFLGGDHSLAIGTVPGVARHAADKGQEQFVLWLDAHPDIHTLDTTASGNLHGTPTAYFTGRTGFDGYPALKAPIKPENICMMGIRSVDPAENAALSDSAIQVYDMRSIDEDGIRAPLQGFLSKVEAANGALHVSLDVDFLDPSIAPAVGTTVPGGATFREAHLIMEMLCDSGLVTSLDLVELNPFLDERGRTAHLMVDLTASLLGRKVLDRPTRSHQS